MKKIALLIMIFAFVVTGAISQNVNDFFEIKVENSDAQDDLTKKNKSTNKGLFSISDPSISPENITLNPRTYARGYKGFFDAGYVINMSDLDASNVQFMTSHGNQFNPYFYLGIGAGFSLYTEWDNEFSIPVFLNPRLSILDRALSPYLDLKLGYSFGDVEGFYLFPSVGIRIPVSHSFRFNLGVGYQLQQTEGLILRSVVMHNWLEYEKKTLNLHGLSFSLGIEF